eukprot:4088511-Amphidinium_carterae.2
MDDWLQRSLNSAWFLANIAMGLTALMGTDWPVFRSLVLSAFLCRFSGHRESKGPMQKHSVWSGPRAVSQLEDHLWQVLQQGSQTVVYITSVWGSYTKYLKAYTPDGGHCVYQLC